MEDIPMSTIDFYDLEKITNGFSDELLIGRGAYGKVYKGVYNGEEVAVKLLHEDLEYEDKTIANDSANIMRIDHPNIVRLVGYYCGTQRKFVEYKGKLRLSLYTSRILCSEYLEGGSLADYLGESRDHDWRTRYNIIKGICEGLYFLHRGLRTPIFHLDLMPRNILLDKSLVPKIRELGQSKLIGTNAVMSRTGTLRHRPPEFWDSQVSEKYDVYSLGIIIIEIMAGYTGYYEFRDMNDATQFIEMINTNWRKWINTTTSPCPSAEWDQVDACIKLAIRCADFKADNRPTTADIVHILTEERRLPVEYQAPFVMGKTGSTLYHMPLQHLKDITKNFCKERILGRGGFGVVYKGVLGNGEMVAVKKLVQSMSSSQEQFENEVNLLMKLEHPNIVRLVGYCYETQYLHNVYEGNFIFAGNTECLLCLECMPKGSLDKYISDASSGLDWPTRHKIIEGVCYGLQYLHEQSDGPIIHLDLKPANILLDENMIPKITDFGLSRLFDQNHSIQAAETCGTLGYMSPEYLRGIITPKSDIFGLGVIIMEVITGHRDYPYDIRKSSTEFIQLELKKWRNVLQKELGYTSLEMDCQQITRCIQIGLICVNPERTKRPTMNKIVDMLEGLENMNWYISNELSSPNIQAEAP